MKNLSISSKEISSWQQQLIDVVTEPRELLSLLDLDLSLLPATERATQLFPLRVPRSFIARMQKGNIHDPLLQQVLPIAAEFDEVEGFVADPLSEQAANPIPGLLHKYHGRVLLTLTGACGVNCRYCFRRHFPYEENNPGSRGWEKALTYVANDTSITEVILSGGDPLVVPDIYLAKLGEKIAAIPHVKTLRIHSRMPIVIPERITDELLEGWLVTQLRPVLVVHSNHPNEIDEGVAAALQRARAAGIMILNQAVLLKGINDSVETLVQLSEALFDVGVLPYYLNLLDKTRGVAHFDVEEGRAKELYQGIIRRLPGYLVPKLVREVPGAFSKLSI